MPHAGHLGFFDFLEEDDPSSIIVPALFRLRDLSLPFASSVSPAVSSSAKSALNALPLAVVILLELFWKASRSFRATFLYSNNLFFSGSFA